MEIHHIPDDEYFVKPRSLLWNILSPPYEYFVLNNEFTTAETVSGLGLRMSGSSGQTEYATKDDTPKTS